MGVQNKTNLIRWVSLIVRVPAGKPHLDRPHMIETTDAGLNRTIQLFG
jgi:hypothetical protein